MTARAYLHFGDRAVALEFPEEFAGVVEPLLGLDAELSPAAKLASPIVITLESPGKFSVTAGASGEEKVATGVMFADAVNRAWRRANSSVAAGFSQPSILMHAASLTSRGRSVLIPARSGRGKSTLSAWLMDRGFRHLADDVAALTADSKVEAIYGPVVVRADVWPMVSRLAWVTDSFDMGAQALLVRSGPKPAAPPEPLPVGLILIPRHTTKAGPRVDLLSPARATTIIMEQNNGTLGDTPDQGLSIALRAARKAVTLRLRYSSFTQIEGIIEPLLDYVLSDACEPTGLQQRIAAVNQALATREAGAKNAATTPRPMPAPTPKKGPVHLTIGMATYDDYDGVYFTIQSLRLYHPQVLENTEFVVIDNHPEGKEAPFLKKLENDIPNYRYVPYLEKSGSAASKQRIFDEAEGRYVLGMDCHVLLVPGAISALLGYFDRHPDSVDLIQGPLIYDGLKNISSHWDPKWRGGMWGIWANDKRADDISGDAFPIPLQGLGCFASRRDAWLGFNPAFRGFGGEEGYLHEKYRRAGRQVLCLPALRWLHRFGRPGGTPYVNRWDDRIYNYYVGFAELGIPIADMEAHFTEVLGKGAFERVRRELGFDPAQLKTLESA